MDASSQSKEQKPRGKTSPARSRIEDEGHILSSDSRVRSSCGGLLVRFVAGPDLSCGNRG